LFLIGCDNDTNGIVRPSSRHPLLGQWEKGWRLAARHQDGHEMPVEGGFSPRNGWIGSDRRLGILR